MKIYIVNEKEVKAFLENLKRATLEKSKEGLMQAGTFVQGEVKASIAGQREELTSVDTGRFLNSVDIAESGDMEVRIFSDIDYAKYLEYGTSKLDARQHFRNTAARVKKAVKEIIKGKL